MRAGLSSRQSKIPIANPPLDMAIKGRAELKRVMDAAGYEVAQ